jgi:hypothetical protein
MFGFTDDIDPAHLTKSKKHYVLTQYDDDGMHRSWFLERPNTSELKEAGAVYDLTVFRWSRAYKRWIQNGLEGRVIGRLRMSEVPA